MARCTALAAIGAYSICTSIVNDCAAASGFSVSSEIVLAESAFLARREIRLAASISF